MMLSKDLIDWVVYGVGSVLVGLFFALTVDQFLTCRPLQQPLTFKMQSEQGWRYLETANLRGFLSLYQLKSAKEQQCYALAVASFSQAYQLDSGRWEVLLPRANAYTQLGQYDLALADYEILLQGNPYDPAVLVNMALIYEKLNQPAVAIATYEQALAQMEQSDYWKQFGLEQMDIYREKLAELRGQAAEANP